MHANSDYVASLVVASSRRPGRAAGVPPTAPRGVIGSVGGLVGSKAGTVPAARRPRGGGAP